jgi:Zn finger protein HypA/HybF involved in hydrogenase expression
MNKKTIRGKLWYKEKWISLCNKQHKDNFDETCHFCISGRWDNVFLYKIKSLLHKYFPFVFKVVVYLCKDSKLNQYQYAHYIGKWKMAIYCKSCKRILTTDEKFSGCCPYCGTTKSIIVDTMQLAYRIHSLAPLWLTRLNSTFGSSYILYEGKTDIDDNILELNSYKTLRLWKKK